MTRKLTARLLLSIACLSEVFSACAGFAVEAQWSLPFDGAWSDGDCRSTSPEAPIAVADSASIAATGMPYTVTVAEPINVGAVLIDSPDAALDIVQTDFSAAGGIQMLT